MQLLFTKLDEYTYLSNIDFDEDSYTPTYTIKQKTSAGSNTKILTIKASIKDKNCYGAAFLSYLNRLCDNLLVKIRDDYNYYLINVELEVENSYVIVSSYGSIKLRPNLNSVKISVKNTDLYVLALEYLVDNPNLFSFSLNDNSRIYLPLTLTSNTSLDSFLLEDASLNELYTAYYTRIIHKSIFQEDLINTVMYLNLSFKDSSIVLYHEDNIRNRLYSIKSMTAEEWTVSEVRDLLISLAQTQDLSYKLNVSEILDTLPEINPNIPTATFTKEVDVEKNVKKIMLTLDMNSNHEQYYDEMSTFIAMIKINIKDIIILLDNKSSFVLNIDNSNFKFLIGYARLNSSDDLDSDDDLLTIQINITLNMQPKTKPINALLERLVEYTYNLSTLMTSQNFNNKVRNGLSIYVNIDGSHMCNRFIIDLPSRPSDSFVKRDYGASITIANYNRSLLVLRCSRNIIGSSQQTVRQFKFIDCNCDVDINNLLISHLYHLQSINSKINILARDHPSNSFSIYPTVESMGDAEHALEMPAHLALNDFRVDLDDGRIPEFMIKGFK